MRTRSQPSNRARWIGHLGDSNAVVAEHALLCKRVETRSISHKLKRRSIRHKLKPQDYSLINTLTKD